MTTTTKAIAHTANATTTGQIAAHLRALADAIDTLGDQPIEKTWVAVDLQVRRPVEGEQRDAERFATTDLLATAFHAEPVTKEDGWRHATVFHGLSIYAAVKKPEPRRFRDSHNELWQETENGSLTVVLEGNRVGTIPYAPEQIEAEYGPLVEVAA